jgi:hypothetical protein
LYSTRPFLFFFSLCSIMNCERLDEKNTETFPCSGVTTRARIQA